MLTRKFGAWHVESVEEAVQSAFFAALSAWPSQGLPQQPAAWLYKVACNHLVGALRQQRGRSRILEDACREIGEQEEVPAEAFFQDEIRDDMLRMLFLCCDETLPRESSLALALKTLCGFSTGEIALRLFTTEANVRKRLARARDRLREYASEARTPPMAELATRLPGVLAVLYLLFNEGCHSVRTDQAIRRELCDEAIRLATLLAGHPVGAAPETYALLALMHFHAARLESRMDESGGLLLLEEQVRSRWNPESIALGMRYLARSAAGGSFSRYHAEAGIAAEHCLAPSFGETRWEKIAGLYAMLDRIEPSPLHTLNRAVAVAEWKGPKGGLAVLQGIKPPGWLEESYLWNAVSSDLHRRIGNMEKSKLHMDLALESAPTEAVRHLLRRRLDPQAGPSPNT